METKQTYIGELPLAEVIKIQETLEPLGYVVDVIFLRIIWMMKK